MSKTKLGKVILENMFQPVSVMLLGVLVIDAPMQRLGEPATVLQCHDDLISAALLLHGNTPC